MKENPKHIQIKEYNYSLPDEKIAKYPLVKRDQSKLLVYAKGDITKDYFFNLPSYFKGDELIVFNNTRVIQARLHFQKTTGATIEVFCLEPYFPTDYNLNFQQTQSCSWLCMLGNAKKWKEGTLEKELLINEAPVTLTVQRGETIGTAHLITFSWNNASITFAELLEASGELPIPPYLNRATEESDIETYQTVYSKIKGSVAAPTAGLHFTPEVLDNLTKKGVKLGEVTLHVGAGTFKPVKSTEIADHEMHTEYIAVTKSTIKQLIDYKGKAIAVGTTSVRTLESLYHIGVYIKENPEVSEKELHISQWTPYETNYEKPISSIDALQAIIDYLDKHKLEVLNSSTQIMIAPGYKFQIVKAIVTNFHQPQSTLLLLISSFVQGNWKAIYNYALENNFRFLSYGDSSLLIP